MCKRLLGLSTTMKLSAALVCALQVYSVVSSSSSQEPPNAVHVATRSGFTLTFEVLDWKEATQACYEWNRTLAFPKSAEEGEVLQTFLIIDENNNTVDIHLGFHDMFFPGHYVTMEGRDLGEVGYWQWDPTSENKTDQRCGALTVAGLKTIDCSTRLESVCQFKESSHYVQVEEFGYYHFYDIGKNWTDAVAECKSWESNLLVLRSIGEYDALFKFFTKIGLIDGGIDLFYGAHQLIADHWFLTLSDELVEESGYDVWVTGEPSDLPGADLPYVGFHLTDSTTPDTDAGMFALASDLRLPFICKRDLHDI